MVLRLYRCENRLIWIWIISGESMDRRLFVIHRDDTTKKVCNGQRKKTDIFLMFQEKEISETPDVLRNSGTINLVTTEVFDSETVLLHIQNIMDSTEYKVYFIGEKMQPIYESIKDPIYEYANGVTWNGTTGVTKAKMYDGSGQTSLMSEVGSNMNNADEISDIFAGFCGVDTQVHTENAKEEPKDDAKEAEPEKSEKTKQKEQRSPEAILQDAKAELVMGYRERLSTHIQKEIRKSNKRKDSGNQDEYSVEDYFKIIKMLTSVASKEDLVKSCQAMNQIDLSKLSDYSYARLKNEADFYFDVCRLLYEKDVFDDAEYE